MRSGASKTRPWRRGLDRGPGDFPVNCVESGDVEARRKILASEDGFSRRQWEAFAELGLLGAPLSEEVGGLGGGPISTMIVMQEFGRHLVVEPLVETVVVAGSDWKSAHE